MNGREHSHVRAHSLFEVAVHPVVLGKIIFKILSNSSAISGIEEGLPDQ